MLTTRPDAARLRLTLAPDKTRIGWTAPGTQQLSVGVQFQDGRRSLAAIGEGAIQTHLAQPVDRLTVLTARARHRSFKSGLFVRHRARAVVHPDVVMLVDVEPSYLAQEPVIREGLRPCGIDNEVRCFA